MPYRILTLIINLINLILALTLTLLAHGLTTLTLAALFATVHMFHNPFQCRHLLEQLLPNLPRQNFTSWRITLLSLNTPLLLAMPCWSKLTYGLWFSSWYALTVGLVSVIGNGLCAWQWVMWAEVI
ncbi:hypothetical protein CLAFUW4_07189 [Fulvia fulva]|uniref:Uncharacterized protein n=1 Tax=Passalora fulva TaxID=5499 RepID=A0A9Q8PBM8_PASFU|nr:uncharacterized protein CLAFUR5_07323 [Fulvia fulva]KAK4622301.1 hypothetical protein CLAFUR4_07197 [Fulvia fulva]KAK4623057.1 hypothetical protein CLAFUR0_07194 [Fulvia fulva]UJO19483.1 hypothetical protein CLAFUR5_07323 [Fulvia fulva]WPV15731.1 hypothetical protein CLAFUW4_07189 [Fulvia fulva]WPV31522.1 hypothetical protein CLAFUW7_07190 [Fulvia fulva]